MNTPTPPPGRLPGWGDVPLISSLAAILGVAEIAADRSGTIVRWTDAATDLYGYTAEEAIGQRMIDLAVAPRNTAAAKAIRSQVVAGATWEGSFTCRHRDGHDIRVQVVDIPLLDEHHQFDGAVSLSTLSPDERSTAQAALTEMGELTELHHGAFRTVEQERERIARELHDGVGQYLTALRSELGVLRRSVDAGGVAALRRMESTLDTALRSLRGVIEELRPRVLDELGICEALTDLVQEFADRTGIDATVTIDEAQLGWIGYDMENTVYRVTQECLANIERHGTGTQVVSVHLTIDHDTDRAGLLLRVQNDGADYDGSRGFGLRSMMARARSHGGSMSVATHPDGGVVAELRVPAERAFVAWPDDEASRR